MLSLFNILFAVWGGILYRYRGAAHPLKKYIGRPIPQILFAAPYAYICYDVIGWWCLIVLIITTLATLSGHGGWHDLGSWDKEREDETLEFIIKPLHKRIPEYWYDVIGLSLSGVSITLLCGAVLFPGDPLAGTVLALSGALKSLSYMTGKTTERGELLTGLSLYFVLSFYV